MRLHQGTDQNGCTNHVFRQQRRETQKRAGDTCHRSKTPPKQFLRQQNAWKSAHKKLQAFLLDMLPVNVLTLGSPKKKQGLVVTKGAVQVGLTRKACSCGPNLSTASIEGQESMGSQSLEHSYANYAGFSLARPTPLSKPRAWTGTGIR